MQKYFTKNMLIMNISTDNNHFNYILLLLKSGIGATLGN